MFLKIQSYSCYIDSLKVFNGYITEYQVFTKLAWLMCQFPIESYSQRSPNVELPVTIGDKLRVSSFNPEFSAPEFIEHVTIRQSLRYLRLMIWNYGIPYGAPKPQDLGSIRCYQFVTETPLYPQLGPPGSLSSWKVAGDHPR